MNYCEKCGTKLEPGATFCVSCGNKIVSTPVKSVNNQDDQNANKLGIISLILHFGAVPIIGFLSNFYILESSDLQEFIMGIGILACYIASYVLMIVGRVKYPKNLLCKVVMWIYIGMIALTIVGIILIVGIIFSLFSFLR